MTSALVFSGGGDYTDPWHPYPETSKRIAGVLEALGCTTLIEDRVADADFHDAQLLVVNAGTSGGTPETAGGLRAPIEAHLRAGRPLLVLHSAAMLFAAPPESAWEGWAEITGVRWDPETSMHPPFGAAVVRVATDAHPIVEGVRGFTVEDERYSRLQVRPDVEPLAWHELDGERHPLLWARTVRDARVVVDLLGHDTRSYDSPEHRELLARAAAWLLDDLG